MSFARNLRFLRKTHGYSQEFLADSLGYRSFTTVQKWESGISEPNVATLKKLAALFGVSMDELVTRDFQSEAADSGECVDGSTELLLDVCRRMRETNRAKVLEYASLLLRDEQNSDDPHNGK